MPFKDDIRQLADIKQ